MNLEEISEKKITQHRIERVGQNECQFNSIATHTAALIPHTTLIISPHHHHNHHLCID